MRIIPSRSTSSATQGHERPRRTKFRFLVVIFTPKNKRSDKRGQCDTAFSLKHTHIVNVGKRRHLCTESSRWKRRLGAGNLILRERG